MLLPRFKRTKRQIEWLSTERETANWVRRLGTPRVRRSGRTRSSYDRSEHAGVRPGAGGMSNLLRRVRTFETRLTDLSGLVPHTEDWLANWKQRIERLLGGQGQGDAGRIPLEAIDALVAAGAAREELPGG